MCQVQHSFFHQIFPKAGAEVFLDVLSAPWRCRQVKNYLLVRILGERRVLSFALIIYQVHIKSGRLG